ncbi:MAG: CusA/CzcA family heavy metal efflux RND transporter [Acidobacteriota bacterium]
MIRALIKFSFTQRFMLLAWVLSIFLAGIYALSTIPIDAFPDLTNNQVTIITEAPGMAAAEIEPQITFPIESAMMGVPHTEEVRSISKFGLSLVTVVFEDRVDTYFARQLINERLQEAKARIPAGLEPTLGPVATAFGEIYQYTIEGNQSPLDLKTLHDWSIRTQLRAVPGVSEINSWGGFTKQFHILVDPARLLKYNLTLRQVFDSVSANNANFGGGFIEHRSEQYIIRGLGLAKNENDLNKIVIGSHQGTPIFLSEVAEVKVGALARQGAVTRDGTGETVSGMIIMLKGENGKAVAERAREKIDEISKSLPADVKIKPFYDQTSVIDRTIQTVKKNLLEGGALVIIILFLFLRNIRASVIVASVIPLSMMVAFIFMRLLGISANLMSLGAIDFGLIVDGAVVMMENFVRHLSEEKENHTPAHTQAILQASALEVARPIVFGVMIIIAVYLPIFTLQGMEGKMFVPMALAVCAALLGSLLMALTYVPAMSSLLLRGGIKEHRGRLFELIRKIYERSLKSALHHKWLTVGVALILVTVAIGSLAFIGTEFMPRLDEGSLLIETRKLPSVSLSESVDISTKVEKIVKSFAEVETVVTKIGRPDVATEAMGIYQGDVYVILHPHESWASHRTKEELIEAMDVELRKLPGVNYNFTQPMAMRLDEVVSGVKADVAVKLYGEDTAVLEREAENIRQVLTKVKGAADVQAEVLSGSSQLQIELNREELARYGLNVQDAQDLVETAVGGKVATELIEEQKRFDVLVRFPEALRNDIEAIADLQLTAPGGERLSLAQVAKITVVNAPEIINHENSQRRIVIQSNVRGRDIGSFVGEAQKAIDREIKLPAGYLMEWGGQFENQQRATRRLMIVVPLALLFIFGLLFAMFGSVKHSFLIIMNVPFALVGGIGALWLRELNLNLSASVGFIALFGVAVLNGVVMVSYINTLRGEGRSVTQAVLEGASVRLRPVLMTALVASLGFIPMALSTNPGAEIQRPLATVVIGGLITSTLLTLFVLPVLYCIFERKSLKAILHDDSSDESGEPNDEVTGRSL